MVVEYVVFDEADRLFEMGFGEQLNETLNRLPESKQMVMFSATLPKMLVDFAKAGLNDPVLIRLGRFEVAEYNGKLNYWKKGLKVKNWKLKVESWQLQI